MTSAYGTPSIKVEGAGLQNGQGPAIKPEPGSTGASPEGLEEDIYEDAGDLDFTQASQAAYLTRLPKWLWEAWSKLDDDAEVQVGTIRVEGAPGDIKRVSHGCYWTISVGFRLRRSADEHAAHSRSDEEQEHPKGIQHAYYESRLHQYFHI